MQKLILIMVISGIFISSGIAQEDIYYTRNATLQVIGKFNDELLFGQTKELGVSLDYETAEIILKFYLNKMEFNIDTIHTIIKDEFREVLFTGKLGLEYINTNSHPPLDFTIKGCLSVDNSKIKLNGEGELHHINDYGNFACMLGMTMKLDLTNLNLDIPSGLYKEAEVVITQALLKKGKN